MQSHKTWQHETKVMLSVNVSRHLEQTWHRTLLCWQKFNTKIPTWKRCGSFSKINMNECQRNVQQQYTTLLSSGSRGPWTARPWSCCKNSRTIGVTLPSMDQFRIIDKNKGMGCVGTQNKYCFKCRAVFSIRKQNFANVTHRQLFE
jgi:hypothetical protein